VDGFVLLANGKEYPGFAEKSWFGSGRKWSWLGFQLSTNGFMENGEEQIEGAQSEYGVW
jgi:hypothetical protein